MKYASALFLILAMCVACADETVQNPGPSPAQNIEWLVPSSEVFDGGPGKDGIPSIDNPVFSLTPQVDFLNPNDLVLVFTHDGVTKAYPHPILDWHEIANDRIGDLALAITYCPLTGTGVAWNRNIQGETTTFGVSGLLYNTNLMPYDRMTNSTWSQQRLDCVNGELIGMEAEVYSLVEMPWSTFKDAFPEASVMNTQTGFSRNYGRYPYTDYRTNQSRLLFPIDQEDGRLPQKERTLGVLYPDEQRVYRFDNALETLNLLQDRLSDHSLAIVRSKQLNVMAAFELVEGREYALVSDEFPVVLADDSGNRYNILGKTVAGNAPDLKMPTQFIGYWFSWGTFYKDIEIYGE
jgi:hypothetical protein